MRALALLLPLVLTGAAAPDDRDFLVSGFERLRVDGPFEVEVVGGGSPRASAEGERRALTRLAIRVEGSTLIVSGGTDGWNLRGGERLETPRIRVGAPDLRSIAINGGGRVRVTGMKAARIDLGINGAGTLDVTGIEASDLNTILTGTGAISLGGKAQRVRLRSNGAGSIDASALTAGEATIVAESSGDTSLAARYNVRVFALGAGTVSVGGSAECAVSGAGPVECAGKMVAAR